MRRLKDTAVIADVCRWQDFVQRHGYSPRRSAPSTRPSGCPGSLGVDFSVREALVELAGFELETARTRTNRALRQCWTNSGVAKSMSGETIEADRRGRHTN